MRGYWDLRQTWREYLGHFDFSGRSVLELGPASGFLGLQIEKAGGRVTSFDIPEGRTIDLLPIPGADMAEVARQQLDNLEHFRRNWRYYHALFESKNEVIYGDIYDLSSLGRRFQVTTLAAILLHLSDPFRALQQAGSITDETIIVTDLQHGGIGDQPFIEFNPNPEDRSGAGWWLLSHGAVSRMLSTIGFERQDLTFSKHRMFESPSSDQYHDHEFFTIVAQR